MKARSIAAASLVAGLLVFPSAATSGTLQQQLDSADAQARRLESAIGADNARIAEYQGRIDDLRARLVGIESSLAVERRLLDIAQTELRDARAHLEQTKVAYAMDRRTLARQLVSNYEADRPSLLDVVLDAHGFADLVERVDMLRIATRHNAQVTARLRDARDAVARQTRTLTALEARRAQITHATLIQKQQLDGVRNELLTRQLVFVRARDRKAGQLGSIRARRRALSQKLDRIEARAASLAVGSFTAGGGAYGFFPAPGTNYSVGNEPEIARRLDRLGKALHLHLIGISGYRTPEHSVEVGGFTNDPHTRGEASDTPGVEGVPEATLNRFGLTRPFGGAAEADHIQLA